MRTIARRGRRPGRSNTRDQLLDAARKVFAERGFDGATTRDIAAMAGVDPGMIRHHFGSKDKLFQAAVNAPTDLAPIVRAALEGPPEDIAERLLRSVLTAWDSPMSSAGIAIIRSATQHEWAASLAREFVLTRGIRPVVSRVETDPRMVEVRASLVASQIGGLLLVRYILKIEPLASADHDQVVAAIGPTIDRYLTGPTAPMV